MDTAQQNLTARILLKLSPALKADFKLLCDRRGLGMSEALREAIQHQLAAEPLLPFDSPPASARAAGAGGRAEQDVRSNTAHLSQNGTTPDETDA